MDLPPDLASRHPNLFGAQNSHVWPNTEIVGSKTSNNGSGSEPDIGEQSARRLTTANPILHSMVNGPKMGPKLRETSAKYVNIRPEMIENARADKVN